MNNLTQFFFVFVVFSKLINHRSPMRLAGSLPICIKIKLSKSDNATRRERSFSCKEHVLSGNKNRVFFYHFSIHGVGAVAIGIHAILAKRIHINVTFTIITKISSDDD